MNYARAIRLARVARGLSQKELANRCEFTPSYICLVEKGTRMPSVDGLEKVADALRVPVFLLTLLASDEQDLRGIGTTEAGVLAQQMLTALVDTTPLPDSSP